MRLGVFGGSFDPPHLGHLLPAIDAAEALKLDEVRFVTSGQQPFKVGTAAASAVERFAMTERLLAKLSGMRADRTEIDRGGLSYTVDTVAGVALAHPQADITLLLGADTYAQFEQWREPNRIRSLVSIAILVRGGDAPPDVEDGSVQILRSRRVDISSTELRARVANGQTIRGFTPDAVADYIAEHRLYR